MDMVQKTAPRGFLFVAGAQVNSAVLEDFPDCGGDKFPVPVLQVKLV